MSIFLTRVTTSSGVLVLILPPLRRLFVVFSSAFDRGLSADSVFFLGKEIKIVYKSYGEYRYILFGKKQANNHSRSLDLTPNVLYST